jgi:hypothetical protein
VFLIDPCFKMANTGKTNLILLLCCHVASHTMAGDPVVEGLRLPESRTSPCAASSPRRLPIEFC